MLEVFHPGTLGKLTKHSINNLLLKSCLEIEPPPQLSLSFLNSPYSSSARGVGWRICGWSSGVVRGKAPAWRDACGCPTWRTWRLTAWGRLTGVGPGVWLPAPHPAQMPSAQGCPVETTADPQGPAWGGLMPLCAGVDLWVYCLSRRVCFLFFLISLICHLHFTTFCDSH